jgi:hypothetical protein
LRVLVGRSLRQTGTRLDCTPARLQELPLGCGNGCGLRVARLECPPARDTSPQQRLGLRAKVGSLGQGVPSRLVWGLHGRESYRNLTAAPSCPNKPVSATHLGKKISPRRVTQIFAAEPPRKHEHVQPRTALRMPVRPRVHLGGHTKHTVLVQGGNAGAEVGIQNGALLFRLLHTRGATGDTSSRNLPLGPC